MFKTLKAEGRRRGYQESPNREGNLEFRIGLITGKEYMFFRIGKIVAQKAGFRDKDRVVLDVDETNKRGILRLDPAGWTLQKTGAEQEHPPLYLKGTWQDGYPYIKVPSKCLNVIAKNQRIEFQFPEKTTFGESVEAIPDELYEEHRDIIENGKPAGRKGKKDGHSFRREADKAPRMKDGKPYGRRHND
jgi:hypothetical protein